MEFKLVEKKKIWTTMSNEEVKSCEAQMIEHLYKGVLCVTVVQTIEEQKGDDVTHLPPHNPKIVDREKKIKDSITLDERAMEICKRLKDQDHCMDGYACQEGLLYYKERVYVPNTLGLRKKP